MLSTPGPQPRQSSPLQLWSHQLTLFWSFHRRLCTGSKLNKHYTCYKTIFLLSLTYFVWMERVWLDMYNICCLDHGRRHRELYPESLRSLWRQFWRLLWYRLSRKNRTFLVRSSSLRSFRVNNHVFIIFIFWSLRDSDRLAGMLLDKSCCRCLEKLEAGQDLNSLGDQIYHHECFVCSACFMPFPDGSFFEVRFYPIYWFEWCLPRRWRL